MNETKLKLPGVDYYFTQEEFNTLRTNIQFSGQDVKMIAVTSCTMNEGKTIISLHLGRSLAEIGKRVLVIDADMRKSVMAGRNAEVRNPVGLSEVITGQEELKDCIFKTQYDNLHILFAGKYPPKPVQLLNSERFSKILEVVGGAYDYILIDTPPLGMVVDAAVIASKCDSAIVVIGNNHVKLSQAQYVVDQLEKSGCNVLGAVINNANKSKKAYSYYRKYKKYSYYAYYTHENNQKTERAK